MAVSVNHTVAGGGSGGGGAGATSYTELADATTVNLTTLNTALAAALAALTSGKQSTLSSGVNIKSINGVSMLGGGDLVVTGVGGQTDATDVAFTAAMPFDRTGFGKRLGIVSMNAAISLSVGPGAVEGGAIQVIFQGDGNASHNITFPAGWIKKGTDIISTSLNARTEFVGAYTGVPDGTVVYTLVALPVATPVDVTPPTLVSATVPDTDPFRINLVWSEPYNTQNVSAAPFAVSAGHPLTGHIVDTATTSHLVTSTAFVPGETKTLAYTAPGSNPFQDLATPPNNLANFAGTAITDQVTFPTLVSAVVSNGTPTKIDLTWSKSMNSTISAAAAFAVSSGHALTTHVFVDATHTQLTTSVAFVAAETKTLAYTIPGSNVMQDTTGTQLQNFSGTAITDNVGGAKITFTDTFTGADGSAPNARWTPDAAGWTIQGNKLNYAGATYSWISTPCTPGDNSVTVTTDFSTASNSYGGIVIRYIDNNNYTSVIAIGSNSEFLRITQVVAGVSNIIADDTVARLGTVGCVLNVATVGNTCTVTVTGGLNPGSFSGTLSANASAAKIALAMNTSKSGDTYDDCILA